MKKKLSALLLMFMALFTILGFTVNAVEPRYTYTTSATSTITNSSSNSSKVYCTATLKGNSTITKIEATQYLEKKNGTTWSTVNGCVWSNSSNRNSLTMSNSKSNLSSGTYRVRTVFKVYSGNNYETVEKVSSEATV